MGVLFPIILLALMWLLVVRPQKERVRRQRELVASLVVGDRVVTAGGLVGTIVALTEGEARVELAPDMVVTVLRPAVSERLDEGGEDG